MLKIFLIALIAYFIILSQIRYILSNLTTAQVYLMRKIGWYAGLILGGLGIYDLWGLRSVGFAIAGIGIILFLIKLPGDIIKIFPEISLKKVRFLVVFSIIFVIFTVAIVNVCFQRYYFNLLEKVQEKCGNNIGIVVSILRIARFYPSYLDETCITLTHTARKCSEEDQKNAEEIVKLLAPICVYRMSLDLQGIRVQKAIFAKMSFSRAKFLRANLSEVDFWLANLDRSDFDRSTLDRAILRNVQCKECRFVDVSARNVDARGGNFKKSYFGWGIWEGSFLDGADMSQSIIKGAAFQKVSLKGVNMEKVDGRWAVFNGADLQNAKLIGGDFRIASFVGTNLKGADLSGAKFEKTNFCGADLRGVKGLESVQIEEMITDDKTLFPEGFMKP